MARLFPWVMALALVLGVGEVSHAVTAAGDDRHLWLVQPVTEGPDALLAHHGPGDAADVVGQVRWLDKPIARRGVAATGQTLYVIYRDGRMQIFEGRRVELDSRWSYESRPGASLPAGTSLRGLAVGRDGPWALLRVHDAATLARLDGQSPSRRVAPPPMSHDEIMRNLRLGLPPGFRFDPSADQPRDAEQPADEANEAGEVDGVDQRESFARVDRLVRLRGGRWRTVALPDDWPHGNPVRLVASSQLPLRLVVRPGGRSVAGLHVYRPVDDGEAETGEWGRETYEEVPAGRAWSAVAVGAHLVAAWEAAGEGDDALRIDAAVLRRERLQSIGALTLAGPTIGWDVAGSDTMLRLVAQQSRITRDADRNAPPPLPWRWTTLDLSGHAGSTPEALQWRAPPGVGRAADYAIMVGVLVSAVLLMLLFWRRDAATNQLDLPETLVLGEIGRRFIAGVVDLLPALLVVMAMYDLSVPELMMRWPGSGTAIGWKMIEPGMLVIGLFVGYTTVQELLMRRTVGKLVVGLRVTDLQGQRPRVWQLLVRNLLKSFDLVAWPLLILLVLGPYRQRLGDLIARTVVVTPADEVDDDDDDDALDDERDEDVRDGDV